ncbi:hypothetical protein DSO57_1003481 [Entomophthora muscae]|uniref:Uncharacterized protein n=1 Tax=Entomophthora muscae TaxID=34485 RepID=A0ACC2UUG1_9FUNG|nr:hypothetical protein DSO57_1003481 [Entomophthora muscae]
MLVGIPYCCLPSREASIILCLFQLGFNILISLATTLNGFPKGGLKIVAHLYVATTSLFFCYGLYALVLKKLRRIKHYRMFHIVDAIFSGIVAFGMVIKLVFDDFCADRKMADSCGVGNVVLFMAFTSTFSVVLLKVLSLFFLVGYQKELMLLTFTEQEFIVEFKGDL